jgi:hypothetical protein
MTKANFYHQALLAVIQPVTQAYILKHGLPFAEDSEKAEETFEVRSDSFEAIADAADFLAMKLTSYWKESDDYFKEQEDES